LGQDNTVNLWEDVSNRQETSEKELIEKDDITKTYKKSAYVTMRF
jgi:hypothetical protein